MKLVFGEENFKLAGGCMWQGKGGGSVTPRNSDHLSPQVF